MNASVRSSFVNVSGYCAEQAGDDILAGLDLAREWSEVRLECRELTLRQRHVQFIGQSLAVAGLRDLEDSRREVSMFLRITASWA